MKQQKNHSPAIPTVKTIEPASERRARRQLEKAIQRPQLVEDWDELDYGFKEARHKVKLK